MRHTISLFLSFLLTLNGVLGAGLTIQRSPTQEKGPYVSTEYDPNTSAHKKDDDAFDSLSSRLSYLQISEPLPHQNTESAHEITTVEEFCKNNKGATIAYYLTRLPKSIRSLSEVKSELASAFDEVASVYTTIEKEQPDSLNTLASFKKVALNVMDQKLAALLHRYFPELKDHTAIGINGPHSETDPGWFAKVKDQAKCVLKLSSHNLAKVTKNIKHELRTNKAIVVSWVLCGAFLMIYISWGMVDIHQEQPVGTLMLNVKNGVADTFWRPSGTVRLYDASVANASIGIFAVAHAHAHPHVLHRMMQAQSDPDGSGLLLVEGVMPLWLNQEATFVTTLGTMGDNLRHDRCDELLSPLIKQATEVFKKRLGRLEGNVTCGFLLDDAIGRLKDCNAVGDLPHLNPGCNTSAVSVPQKYDGLVFFHYKKDPEKGNIRALSLVVSNDPRYVTPTEEHTHTASLQALPSPSGTRTASQPLNETDTDELTESMSRLRVSESVKATASASKTLDVAPPQTSEPSAAPAPQYVYWATDGTQATIYRALINTTDGTAINPHPWATGVNSPLSFSIDTTNGRLYVGGTSLDVFRMTNTTPTTLSDKITLLNASVSSVKLFLDQATSTLYSLRTNIVTQNSVDLTNPTALTNSSYFLQTSGSVYGGYVDAFNSRIYLAEGNNLRVGELVAGKVFWQNPIVLHSTIGSIKGVYLSGNNIYWKDDRGVYFADIDRTNPQAIRNPKLFTNQFISGNGGIFVGTGVSQTPPAAEPAPQYVYWAADGMHTIYRAKINTTDWTAINPEIWIANGGLVWPFTFSIDRANGRLYVGEQAGVNVYRMTNTTPPVLSAKRELLNGAGQIIYTFLDKANGCLYSWNTNIMTRGQVNLTNPTTLTNSSTFLQTLSTNVYGAFVDAINGYIYLAEGNRLKVGKLAVGKTVLENPIDLHNTTGSVSGVYLLGNKIYWKEDGGIYIAYIDRTNPQPIRNQTRFTNRAVSGYGGIFVE